MSEIINFADVTPRLNLALLHAAQAQKEITHNEALAKLDILLAPCVLGIVADPSGLNPVDGNCWIVGVSATGDWLERDNQIAGWTSNGWIFASPVTGQRAFGMDQNADYFFDGVHWIVGSSVALPSGGSVIDVEARQAIADLISALENHALLVAS